MFSPLPIGEFGLRNAVASSRTSSVVRSDVHSVIAAEIVDPLSDRVSTRSRDGSSAHSGCPTMAQKSSHCWPVPTIVPT
jgi:hypothetical protein